ncbi:MAG: ChaN family lipoprotein [Gemmatimonadaceae bacterium]|jgi:uncharacterized iron-regulated protein|nr:ChaN family lipoprotein [Gemmatimonadaceae bacterium]
MTVRAVRCVRRSAGALVIAVTGCARPAVPPPTPEVARVVEATSGATLSMATLLDRLRGVDYVLLGEQHDNVAHHRARGALVAQARPVLVFEHFAFRDAPLPMPAADEADTTWLDRAGFDRKAWQWPRHEALVRAARGNARPMWGSNVASATLRPVIRSGVVAAPVAFREIVERAPLDSAGRAVQDREIIDGHCGQLPEAMVPGMRMAQEVRDAAMAAAMLSARRDGPVWLVAGNGHVRKDVAVPRVLRAVAPGARVVSVGLMELDATGAAPPAPAEKYDYVVYTPAPERREDPCAGMTMPARRGR